MLAQISCNHIIELFRSFCLAGQQTENYSQLDHGRIGRFHNQSHDRTDQGLQQDEYHPVGQPFFIVILLRSFQSQEGAVRGNEKAEDHDDHVIGEEQKGQEYHEHHQQEGPKAGRNTKRLLYHTKTLILIECLEPSGANKFLTLFVDIGKPVRHSRYNNCQLCIYIYQQYSLSQSGIGRFRVFFPDCLSKVIFDIVHSSQSVFWGDCLQPVGYSPLSSGQSLDIRRFVTLRVSMPIQSLDRQVAIRLGVSAIYFLIWYSISSRSQRQSSMTLNSREVVTRGFERGRQFVQVYMVKNE